MTELNPMDSYRDRYPWPYEWLQEFAEPLENEFAAISVLWEHLDPWTYRHHVTFTEDPGEPRYAWVTDLYWSELVPDRGQMPLDEGDQIASFLVERVDPPLRLVVWNGRQWRPSTGWTTWTGEQGDFVTCIHCEWNSEMMSD